MGNSTTSVRPNILQLLVDNSVDGQFLIDVERNVFLRVNPALCSMTGHTSDELLDESFHGSDIVHPEDRRAFEEAKDIGGDTVAHNSRFRIVSKSSDVREVECRTLATYYMGRPVVVGSLRDVTDQIRLEEQLRGKISSEESKVKDHHAKALEVVNANNRLLQMVESLKAVPELSKRLSSLDEVDDVIKQACLYITNQEEGLQFGSCVIYLRQEGRLEVAYANPFRMTTYLRIDNAHPIFSQLLNGKADIVVTDQGNRLAPIKGREGIIGVLEVGVGRTLRRIFEHNDQVLAAQENVIKSIADFIGIQIANLQLRDAIQQQVILDKLTGLYNRRHFDSKLANEFRRAVRYQRDLSLLVVDIDHFKKVNDTHGHPQGDAVLKVVTGILGSSFRDIDTVCRIGGEEISVIMPETSVEDAKMKAEQVRDAIEKCRIGLAASKTKADPDATMSVTISIGVACINNSIESEDHLFQEADRLLYIAKNSGRNRVCSA